MSFENDIKNWVALDNQYKRLSEQMKELRSKRNSVEEKIIDHVEENGLNKATVMINDGKLRFSDVKTTSPLTLKYVEKCLSELIRDENKVSQIMGYIKENRDVKNNSIIRRLYTE
jgi:seryl-tRNA synthetase|tara:strand:+ start:1828 stop:2172 length:345 start_codon:yes stop_codon:yes gene_type:complete